MSALSFRIASNKSVHGVRFAFDHEYERARRAGCCEQRAFALAASFVFGRVVL